MHSVKVTGGRPLTGTISIEGYKHSLVLLMNAALLLSEGSSTLDGVSKIQDIAVLVELVEKLGCRPRVAGTTLTIEAYPLTYKGLSEESLSSVHGTMYLMPVLLARLGISPLFVAGGCKIEDRSEKHVIDVLLRMGAIVDYEKKELRAPRGLVGADIDLSPLYPLSGRSSATKTALLAGSLARGTTRIKNPYLRQEILDLIDFLQCAGGSITLSNDKLEIHGVNTLRGSFYRIPSDFLEWATFILACANSGGNHIRLNGVPPLASFGSEVDLLQQSGLDIKVQGNYSEVSCVNGLSSVQVECPPIISDLQPLLASTLGRSSGKSTIIDNEWPKRFGYVQELQKMGGDFALSKNRLEIQGPVQYGSAAVIGSDLRNTASLLLAALGATGTSLVFGIEHLNRGYDNLIPKLKTLGALIERED